MYSNVASSFVIQSFVSPSPTQATNNEKQGGGANGGVDEVINNIDDRGGSEHVHVHSSDMNITAFLKCKFPQMSETSVNVTFQNNNFGSGTNSPSASYAEDNWENTGNRDDWTIGGGGKHHGDGEEDSNSNYNNYHSQYHHNQFHQELAAIHNAYDDDDGSGGGGSFGEIFCTRDWDDILCWPKTAAGEVATLPCFEYLHGISYNASGFAKRLCMEGGEWNKTEYSECKPFPPVANITTDTGNLDITTGIYFFGYCLSLVAVLIAAGFFISFKELRCLRNTIHSHLMVTYVLADALWVLSLISTDQGRTAQHTTKATCFTFILLHYFHLTKFFWMFVEVNEALLLPLCISFGAIFLGLYLYVLVVQTFMTQSIRLRTYCVIGWGLPFLVVISWSVAKWVVSSVDETVKESTRNIVQMDEEVEFNAVVCPWFHANQYDWIYKISALLVLVANLMFLLQIMWVLITKLRSATSQETQQSRKAAKAFVVLMPLLGITYVLVLIGPKKWPLFEHTRAFLISTQGFLVALLYCFLNAEVRMAIRHRWNRMEIFGSDLKCCFCCSYSSNQQNMQNLRDWSPRSRTESIRLYTPTPGQHYRKRESSASETTMMTAVGTSNCNNGGGHGANSTGTTGAGNGSTSLITTMAGRRISTTPLRPTTTFTEESEMV